MTAKYQRIVEDILAKISAGQLQPGDRVGSMRELRAQYGVSEGSIRGAMLTLKAMGILEGRQGDGVYVK